MTTLKLKRNQMVSSTDIVRKFSEYLDRTGRKERLFVTRNNLIEAVLINIEDYERLIELEELLEHLEIAQIIEKRMPEPSEKIDLETLIAHEGFGIDELRQLDPES